MVEREVGSSSDEIDAAVILARSLLAEQLPRRWSHSEGVMWRAVSLRGLLGDGDARVLAQAAVLHDVGYSPSLAVTGFHPLDGARHLRALGVEDEVVSLVAHHSLAAIEAAERGLSEELREFAAGASELSDCLTYCDMTISPDGLAVTIDARIADVRVRYGPDSVVGRFIGRAEGELRAATRRVEHLVSAAPGAVPAPSGVPGRGQR